MYLSTWPPLRTTSPPAHLRGGGQGALGALTLGAQAADGALVSLHVLGQTLGVHLVVSYMVNIWFMGFHKWDTSNIWWFNGFHDGEWWFNGWLIMKLEFSIIGWFISGKIPWKWMMTRATPLVKHTQKTMENHHFQGVNQLFQWPFSSSQTVSLPECTSGNSHPPPPWDHYLPETIHDWLIMKKDKVN